MLISNRPEECLTGKLIPYENPVQQGGGETELTIALFMTGRGRGVFIQSRPALRLPHSRPRVLQLAAYARYWDAKRRLGQGQDGGQKEVSQTQ